MSTGDEAPRPRKRKGTRKAKSKSKFATRRAGDSSGAPSKQTIFVLVGVALLIGAGVWVSQNGGMQAVTGAIGDAQDSVGLGATHDSVLEAGREMVLEGYAVLSGIKDPASAATGVEKLHNLRLRQRSTVNSAFALPKLDTPALQAVQAQLEKQHGAVWADRERELMKKMAPIRSGSLGAPVQQSMQFWVQSAEKGADLIKQVLVGVPAATTDAGRSAERAAKRVEAAAQTYYTAAPELAQQALISIGRQIEDERSALSQELSNLIDRDPNMTLSDLSQQVNPHLNYANAILGHLLVHARAEDFLTSGNGAFAKPLETPLQIPGAVIQILSGREAARAGTQ